MWPDDRGCIWNLKPKPDSNPDMTPTLADSDTDSNPWQVLVITRLYPITGSAVYFLFYCFLRMGLSLGSGLVFRFVPGIYHAVFV